MLSLMNEYSDDEFRKIILNSFTYRDCLKKIGYTSFSGYLYNKLKQRIDDLQINISHFKIQSPIVRTRKNVFIKNSTCNQSTLRRWFLKENIEYKCSICGQKPYWNNKKLTLILDHINGCNHDDRLENLRWVCPNCNYQLETTNGKNIKKKNCNKKYCIDCGKLISAKSTRCINCDNEFRKTKSTQKITREELKDLIRTTPFVKIGKMFSVSDNAVRKWCRKFNLPYKTSEIKNYTNEEWLAI